MICAQCSKEMYHGRVIVEGERKGQIVCLDCAPDYDPRRHFRFENYVDNHIALQPVEVTSPGHRDRLMKENALEVRPREHINDLNHRRWQRGLPPLPR